jgi:hypothetical protein
VLEFADAGGDDFGGVLPVHVCQVAQAALAVRCRIVTSMRHRAVAVMSN